MIMPTRYDFLVNVLHGYQKTGISLVAYDSNNNFMPFSSVADDMGLYYVIPKIAHTCDISIKQAVSFFLHGSIFIASFVALLGFFFLHKSILGRIIACIAIFDVAYLMMRYMDIYIMYSIVAIGLVPFFLYFLKKSKITFSLIIWVFISGIIIGTVHYMRSYSSFAVLIFMVSSILLYLKETFKYKVVLILVLLTGCLLPIIHFNCVFAAYSAYARSINWPTIETRNNHVFWHSVLAGFGFLNNDLGIKWDDEIIINKIKNIAPDIKYPSDAYETIARQEVINLIKNHFYFVLSTIFAKVGILLLILLRFAFFGLLAALLCPMPLCMQLPFLCAISFNALFGLIALPLGNYLLGFIACAVLYSIYAIMYAIELGLIDSIKTKKIKVFQLWHISQ
jgi:hypothetical protein